jgi:membrane fusion protein, copper/silver efflux system
MNLVGTLALFIMGVALGSAGMFIYERCSTELERLVYPMPANGRKVLYYRDPSGAPYWSAAPKKDASGRDYVPVYEDEEKLNLGEERKSPP